MGLSASATSASSSTLFGYIFGTSSYDGGTSTKQYYSNSKYATYYIPTTLTTVTITGGNILYGAFYNCSKLTSIVINDDIVTIGDYAFYKCTSLKSVYYCGTASEWSAISIGSNNTYLTNTTIYYYSASEPDYTDGYNYWCFNENGEIVVWVQSTEE